MRVYTVHYRRRDQGAEIRLVKEGFSWPAFLFTVFWALWHGLWIVAVGMMAAGFVVGMAEFWLDPVTDAALALGVQLLIGLTANDLRRWTLERRGFTVEAVVAADGAEDAYRRFMENTPHFAGGVGA